jgi:hypothetical protein
MHELSHSGLGNNPRRGGRSHGNWHCDTEEAGCYHLTSTARHAEVQTSLELNEIFPLKYYVIRCWQVFVFSGTTSLPNGGELLKK